MIKYRTRIIDDYSNGRHGYNLISNERSGRPTDQPTGPIIPSGPATPTTFSIQFTDGSYGQELTLFIREPLGESEWSIWDADTDTELFNSTTHKLGTPLPDSITFTPETSEDSYEYELGYMSLLFTINDSDLHNYEIRGALDAIKFLNYEQSWGDDPSPGTFTLHDWSNQTRRYEFEIWGLDIVLPDYFPAHITSTMYMFQYAQNFNRDISSWDMSNVTEFYYMFNDCQMFNQPLDTWDVSSAVDMEGMFYGCEVFNQPLNSWNTSNVQSFIDMFSRCKAFDQPLSNWKFDNAANVRNMFNDCTNFNQDISMWDLCNVSEASNMLRRCQKFNQPLNSLDVSKIDDLRGFLSGCVAFNQDLSSWRFKEGAVLSDLFQFCRSFNQDITMWDISKVRSIDGMFEGASSFNQDISSWDVSNIDHFSDLFRDATSFNQDISVWDVSNAVNMSYMFAYAAAFNRDISNWNVSNVQNMMCMFSGATSFNQDLSQWCVPQVQTNPLRFSMSEVDRGGVEMSQWTLPKPVWGTCPRGEVAFERFDVEDRIELIMTNSTDAGSGADIQISAIKTQSDWYEIYRDDVLVLSNTMTSNTHSHERIDDTLRLTIRGADTYNNGGLCNYKVYIKAPIIEIKKLYTGLPAAGVQLEITHLPMKNRITTMLFTMLDLPLIMSAQLPPSCTQCKNMFQDSRSIIGGLSHWDVSKVSYADNMFLGCTNFNLPLGDWDLKKLYTANYMFKDCTSFNQDLSKWSMPNLYTVKGMFQNCTSFNQDLSTWCTPKFNALNPTNLTDFDTGAINWTLPKPVWGTCPLDVDSLEFSFTPMEDYDQYLVIILDLTWSGTDWSLVDVDNNVVIADYTSGYRDPIRILHTDNTTKRYAFYGRADAVTIQYESRGRPHQVMTLTPEAKIEITKYSKHVKSHRFHAQLAELVVPESLPEFILYTDQMFAHSYLFNQDISKWDVSRVDDMAGMFKNCTLFNQDISKWDVSNVSDYDLMFDRCFSFNAPIINWSILPSSQTNYMFQTATAFNQDLSNWIIENSPYQWLSFDNGAMSWTLPRPNWIKGISY